MRTTAITRVLVLILAAAPIASAEAHAAPAAAEAKVPAPPSPAAEQRRAELFAALAPELHAPLLAVVVDTSNRMRAAMESDAAQIDARQAARDALLAADFGGLSKRDKATVEAVTDLVVLQLAASSHAAVRDGVGQQLAFRAVRKCAGDSSCIDAIAPTETMTSANIRYVQDVVAQGAAESATAEKRVAAETKTLVTIYSRSNQAKANLGSKFDKTADAVIQKLRG